MDAPETPAPVFAMRAFRSALFGTPAGEDNGNASPVTAKRRENPVLRRKGTMPQTIQTTQIQQQPNHKPSSDPVNQLSLSPTKSILVTPGTTSNRRKTVSFGETAFREDAERKETLSKSNSATVSSMGSVTSQWMSGQSDGKSRPRSRLTQSLLDAKENATEDIPKTIVSTRNEDTPAENEGRYNIGTSLSENHNDETIDLDDPRSQSGQYWKTEFENYRKRTNLEIKKLIQYRSVARSYARKKDIEAMRLIEKLRREEEKVADMECRVTGLASDMVSVGIDADREKLVQDLARQTALAVQYKHKVDSLRKALERNGIVGSQDEQTDFEGTSRDDRAEISRLQKALDDANRKLEERSQDDQLSKLRDLAKSSELKVSELEGENALLKQTIARVKGEMGKYDERRVEKEAKLKQRAAEWKSKCQESQKKLLDYRTAVREERQMYQQQILALNQEIAGMSHSKKRVSANVARRNLEEKAYAGVQIHDFGGQRSQVPIDKDDEMLQVSFLRPKNDVFPAYGLLTAIEDNRKHRESRHAPSRLLIVLG